MVVLAVTADLSGATMETVATGLNNPRGLNFGPEGALYVAEAGSGGAGPCGPGEDGERCYGASSSITRLDLRRGTQERTSTGFPSLALPDGSIAVGAHDIAFGRDGALYVLEIARNGLLGAFEGGDWTGSLIRVAPDGTRTEIASEGLFAPGGVALGTDGAFYVTNNSIFSGTGEVLRIRP